VHTGDVHSSRRGAHPSAMYRARYMRETCITPAGACIPSPCTAHGACGRRASLSQGRASLHHVPLTVHAADAHPSRRGAHPSTMYRSRYMRQTRIPPAGALVPPPCTARGAYGRRASLPWGRSSLQHEPLTVHAADAHPSRRGAHPSNMNPLAVHAGAVHPSAMYPHGTCARRASLPLQHSSGSAWKLGSRADLPGSRSSFRAAAPSLGVGAGHEVHPALQRAAARERTPRP